MLNRTVMCLMAILILTVLIGCSSKNQGLVANPGEASVSSFTLSVLDDTYFNGASADKYTLTVDEYDEEVVVNINVEGAQDLKALFAELAYDSSSYRPMTGQPTTAMGDSDDLLVLSVLGDTGVVHYNQILKNPDWRTGLNGDSMVAQVSFKKAPAVETRFVSTPPTSADSASVLAWDDGTSTLTWAYYSIGDYDQNTEVGASDLVPIAQNFGATNTPAQFPITDIESVIDGDHNTEIGSADMVPIAQNFGNSTLGGYNIFHSTDAGDYPAAGTVLDNVAISAATNAANITTERLQFSYVVGAPVANDYYWVRPSDGSTDGIASNIVGDTGNLPQLALTTPAEGGDGSSLTPYEFNVTTGYVFTLTDPAGPTDVSVDANTVWTVAPASAGTMDTSGATAFLNVEDAFTGDFTVAATYNGISSNPSFLSCTVDGGGGGDIEIMPDTADADWTGITGDGTELDPYILDETDLAKEYDLIVQEDSVTQSNGDYTWSAFPPFIVSWDSGLPPLTANQFTSGYLFAQDTTPTNSNNLYVEIHAIPAT